MTLIKELIPQTIVASLSKGGVEATGTIEGDTGLLQRGDYIVLRGMSFAGYRDTEERDVLSGWLTSDPTPIRFDRYSSTVTVKFATSDGLLRGGSVQAISGVETTPQNNAHEWPAPMKISDNIFHVLQDHCNFVQTTENPNGIIDTWFVDTAGSTQRDVFIMRASDNLWSNLQRYGGGEKTSEFFRPWFDRYNTFYYQKAPAFWSTPPTSIGTLHDGLILGQPTINIRNTTPGDITGQVILETKGLATNTTYQSQYPASALAGKIVRTTSGLWASSQADSNEKAQNLFRWLTRPYTMTVQIDPGLLFFEGGRGIRLADAIDVVYDGPANNNGLHINLNNKFYVYGYNVRYDYTRDTATATLTLEADN